jgi:Ca2+-binding EF-hand superfamily protein
MEIVEKFWHRIQQKFVKLNETFRFFDRNFDNQISFKEFRVVCEELDLRYTHE